MWFILDKCSRSQMRILFSAFFLLMSQGAAHSSPLPTGTLPYVHLGVNPFSGFSYLSGYFTVDASADTLTSYDLLVSQGDPFSAPSFEFCNTDPTCANLATSFHYDSAFGHGYANFTYSAPTFAYELELSFDGAAGPLVSGEILDLCNLEHAPRSPCGSGVVWGYPGDNEAPVIFPATLYVTDPPTGLALNVNGSMTPPAPMPEPDSLSLLALGLLAIAFAFRHPPRTQNQTLPRQPRT